MPANRLKEFLNDNDINYTSIRHSAAMTAPEVAASAHVAGRNFAKTVIVMIEGAMAMVVVPANRKVDLADLRDLLAVHDVRLASEDEFKDRFPDCELGAMPPFGNLYGLPVYVEQSLAEQPMIAFNACTHSEVIKMSFADFADVVMPTVLEFSTV